MGRNAITYLYTESINMQVLNNQLKRDLKSFGSAKLVREIFDAPIRLYDPVGSELVNGAPMDSFTVNQLIAMKNLALGNVTTTLTPLRQRNDALTSINNTANDYLVASEMQIGAIKTGLEEIVADNKNLTIVILIIENIALIALAASLIMVARVVIRTHSRTFRALTQLTSKSIEERIFTVKKFQQSLNENIETKTFSENLGLFLHFAEDSNPHKFEDLKAKDNGRKFGSRNFTLHHFMVYIGHFAMTSFGFLIITSGIFALLYLKSIESFNTLNSIKDQLAVTNKVTYQSSIVLSSFYFFALFKNDSSYKIRNEQAIDQLDENIASFGNVNKELLDAIFGWESWSKDDSTLKRFLQSDFCPFVASSLQVACRRSTLTGRIGLLGLNTRYYMESGNFITLLKDGYTEDALKALCTSYLEAVAQDITFLDSSYNFLTSYLLEGFRNQVHSLERLNLFLSIASLLFIIITTIEIQMVTLNKLIHLDNSQKKLFRSLIYHVFSQNKAVGFLLKKEFGEEVEGLNRVLY